MGSGPKLGVGLTKGKNRWVYGSSLFNMTHLVAQESVVFCVM